MKTPKQAAEEFIQKLDFDKTLEQFKLKQRKRTPQYTLTFDLSKVEVRARNRSMTVILRSDPIPEANGNPYVNGTPSFVTSNELDRFRSHMISTYGTNTSVWEEVRRSVATKTAGHIRKFQFKIEFRLQYKNHGVPRQDKAAALQRSYKTISNRIRADIRSLEVTPEEYFEHLENAFYVHSL